MSRCGSNWAPVLLFQDAAVSALAALCSAYYREEPGAETLAPHGE